MAITHLRSSTKPSGGRRREYRKKKKYDLAGLPSHTKIGPNSSKVHSMRGGNRSVRLLLADSANVYDPSSKKISKVKIKTVVSNPANRHFVRRNILTKGAEIDTDIGKARITSRPSKDGVVNAVLIK